MSDWGVVGCERNCGHLIGVDEKKSKGSRYGVMKITSDFSNSCPPPLPSINNDGPIRLCWGMGMEWSVNTWANA